jgi:anthranilate synthase component 2
MKTLIIDNFDSFTYNLFQYIGELNGRPIVKKNSEITLDEIKKLNPTHIVISPGPGTAEKKEDFGICMETINTLGKKTPILGVCLGHQGIVLAFGGKITKAPEIMHGKTSPIAHNNRNIFKGVKNPFTAMRYHSLCADRKGFPPELSITAWEKKDKTIMGISHINYPIFGIQFHPESFKTIEGKKILLNFLQYVQP